MNFSTRLFARRDGNSGWLVNGSWGGAIGNLARGEADLLAAATMMLPARRLAVAFLLPVNEDGWGLFVSRRSAEERAWMSFLYPLRYASRYIHLMS